jgi:hypothetical protein
MYDCPRLGQSHDIESRYSENPPEQDRYGGYLGWHAAMVVAGELIQTRPVSGYNWTADPLGDFLADVDLSRPDGLWLADITDLAPTDLVSALSMPDDDKPPQDETEVAALLGPIFGLTDSLELGDHLTVAGYTVSGDLTISVGTVLADKRDTRRLAAAALTDTAFHRWLPHTQEAVERNCGGPEQSVLAWIESDRHSDERLDRHDPYNAPRAQQRPRPEAWIQEQNGLRPTDPAGRFWSNGSAPAFLAEAWGRETGRGERRSQQSGERLRVARAFLLTLLQEQKRELVVMVKAQRYFSKEGARGDAGHFVHRLLMLSVDHNATVRVCGGPSDHEQAIVAALSDYDRSEFRARFEALKSG